MGRSSNFTDGQKATLFVLGKAMCAYTGRNLWLLDYGADPNYEPDWADHVIPVSRGGTSTLDNGVCAGFQANFDKGKNSLGHTCWFRDGKPTSYYRKAKVPPRLRSDIQKRLRRFAALHISDWYFNRAIWLAYLGVWQLHYKGNGMVRDDHYYARASYKKISKWQTLVSRDAVPSIESRGLAPASPSPDQEHLLQIREATSVDELHDIMFLFLRHFSASTVLLDKLDNVRERASASAPALLVALKRSRLAAPGTRTYIQDAIGRLGK